MSRETYQDEPMLDEFNRIRLTHSQIIALFETAVSLSEFVRDEKVATVIAIGVVVNSIDINRGFMHDAAINDYQSAIKEGVCNVDYVRGLAEFAGRLVNGR